MFVNLEDFGGLALVKKNKIKKIKIIIPLKLINI